MHIKKMQILSKQSCKCKRLELFMTINANTHDWSIDKPYKADFEKDLNCIIACLKVQPHLCF